MLPVARLKDPRLQTAQVRQRGFHEEGAPRNLRAGIGRSLMVSDPATRSHPPLRIYVPCELARLGSREVGLSMWMRWS